MNDFMGNGSVGANEGNPQDIYGCIATAFKQGVYFNIELIQWKDVKRFAEWLLEEERKQK